ncbi:CBS domain-containing protein [Lentzea sp. PSKA42]|jgi:CBS domain-containing protein|uniref:CBS domain-containing protein n=1 Tax=Lentzea indica TaxID=2604800 RepID=A0ABX1FTN8_9PSEU|nr:CBS domain-containing protein [Lentzea indica]NKE62403.1 CBS domain-containing protein [Lentzea indica]
MTQLVRDLMTVDPVVLPPDAPVREAAKAMRDRDIGDVLVVEGDRLYGIVTDRDLVVRAMADRDDMSDCCVRDVCSDHVVTADMTETLDTAIARMRENAVRRIPVVDAGRPVGVLSLGDAAVERDPNSVLGQVSAAPGNN